MVLTHKQINEAYDQGRVNIARFNKTPSQTTGSGIAYDLSMSSGNPIAQYYSGVTLTSTALKRSTDVGLNHGQPVGSAYKKYIHKLDLMVTSGTAAPLTLNMLDYLMFYGGISMDAGVQSMNNTITLPRYDSGQMMLVELFPYTGSATCQVTYTNQDGVAGKQTRVITLNTQAVFGTIASSSPATLGANSDFLPLDHGDSGVQLVESIEFFGGGDVGVLALVIVRPMLTGMIVESTSPIMFETFRDFKVMLPVEDDAYLNFICTPVGTLAGANICGHLTTIWSPTT